MTPTGISISPALGTALLIGERLIEASGPDAVELPEADCDEPVLW
jgi:hypothetical protein